MSVAIEDRKCIIIERKFGEMSEAEQYRREILPLLEWNVRVEEIRKTYMKPQKVIGEDRFQNYSVEGWRIIEI